MKQKFAKLLFHYNIVEKTNLNFDLSHVTGYVYKTTIIGNFYYISLASQMGK